MRVVACIAVGLLWVGEASGEAGGEAQSRVLVKSPERISVRSTISAVVSEMPFRAGMRFAKGDRLIAYDCSRQRAELDAAKASLQATEIEKKNKKRLVRHRAAGRSELEVAVANENKARAEHAALKAHIRGCSFEAPFAGRVVETRVGIHELPERNQPVMVILNDSHLELQMVVPSNWLGWLREGVEFRVGLDETGVEFGAFVTRLGAEVDPVSQTIQVFGKVEGGPPGILAGMSGTATFQKKLPGS